MKPKIDISSISNALADVLAEHFPDSTIYDNPNQQGTELPAWFINYIPGSTIKKAIDNRYWRNLHIDLVYLVEYDLPDLYDQYRAAAEILDEVLETFKYTKDGQDYLIRTYDRTWKMDLSAMHYELRLDLRVSKETIKDPFMQRVDDLNETIT
jgi:hypothetical protein